MHLKLFLTLGLILNVEPHGRLIDPPSRSSLWRFNEFKRFNPPINYDDNGLNCGGFYTQYVVNSGLCGVCGDDYSQPKPRKNEDGGTFGRGIIVRSYNAEEIIDVSVELTAPHKGHFEFQLCPQRDATEECFYTYQLQLAEKEGETKYYVKKANPGIHKITLILPFGVTCSNCVLRWEYRAGNNWGICPNGTGRVGCGPQETFRSCADIEIINN